MSSYLRAAFNNGALICLAWEKSNASVFVIIFLLIPFKNLRYFATEEYGNSTDEFVIEHYASSQN